MIEFTIDPPSGHADSYLDVRFVIKFDRADIASVEFTNLTVNKTIEVLSVSTGFIQRETMVVAKKCSRIEGYINLFNKDKMNLNLKEYIKVDIRCNIVAERGGVETKETADCSFYNESQSLDADIAPFDLVIDNPHVDLRNHIPLRMHLICDSEQKYELCVKSEDGSSACTFEVITRPGRTSFSVPAAVLWSDLDLRRTFGKRFYLYWVKFEGINHMNFKNRKYMRIHDGEITFNTKMMQPMAQSRLGPTEVDLPSDFVLSDRYFVHTFKSFSAFGDFDKNYDHQRMNNLTRFLHESQDLRDIGENAQSFGDSSEQNNINEARRSMRKEKLVDLAISKQRVNMQAFAFTYQNRPNIVATDSSFKKSIAPTKTTLTPRRQGGCGCARQSNG